MSAGTSIGDQGPKIVTICGSTRFRAEIAEANRMLTLAGHIVLAPGVFAHDGDEITEQQKQALDKLHFKKIDMARWIYVVNPGGYIGESTCREIEYARRTGKGVLALVAGGIDGWSPEAQAEAAAEMAVQRAALTAQLLDGRTHDEMPAAGGAALTTAVTQ